VEGQCPGRNLCVRGRQAHNGPAGLRLARPRLAHYAQPLAPEKERYATHGLQPAGAAGNGHAEILHLQQGFAHWPPLRGSSASRRPSPSRLKPRLTMRMAKPGIAATHHWSRMKRRPEAIIAPHSGSGGCAPRPRKPSPAAVRMMPAMSSVTRTMSEEMHKGMMWRSTMRHGEAPISRTAEI